MLAFTDSQKSDTSHRCQYHRARCCPISGAGWPTPSHKLCKQRAVITFTATTYFTVLTDRNPQAYLLTSAKLDAPSYRWLTALSMFSFKLLYHAGKQNGGARWIIKWCQISKKREKCKLQFIQDHLSDPKELNSVDQSVVQAICERQLICSVGHAEGADGVALDLKSLEILSMD